MSDKVYRWLIAGVSIVLALGLGLSFGKSSSGQKSDQGKQGSTQLVLTPKAHLPSEDARWTFAPDVPVPIGRREQRRKIVHWTIREAQSEIAPGVIYDDAWGFEGHVSLQGKDEVSLRSMERWHSSSCCWSCRSGF